MRTPVDAALVFGGAAASAFLASAARLMASTPFRPPAPPRRRTSGLPKVRAPKPFVPAAAPAYGADAPTPHAPPGWPALGTTHPAALPPAPFVPQLRTPSKPSGQLSPGCGSYP